jgi:hypothetical protein
MPRVPPLLRVAHFSAPESRRPLRGARAPQNLATQPRVAKLAHARVQTLGPDGDGKVLTQIFIVRNVNFGSFTCQPGMSLKTANVTLTNKGENYFGGSANGQLVFAYP